MTVQNIKAAIDSALPFGAQGKYPNEYEALVAALTEREYTITEVIVEQVSQRFGVSESQVKAQAEALGLAVRPVPEPEPTPDPEPVAEADGSVEGRLARVEESLATIAASVASLSALADRHLGARR